MVGSLCVGVAWFIRTCVAPLTGCVVWCTLVGMTTTTQHLTKVEAEYLQLRRRMTRAVASVHGTITKAENDRRDELEALLTVEQVAQAERLMWS